MEKDKRGREKNRKEGKNKKRESFFFKCLIVTIDIILRTILLSPIPEEFQGTKSFLLIKLNIVTYKFKTLWIEFNKMPIVKEKCPN